MSDEPLTPMATSALDDVRAAVVQLHSIWPAGVSCEHTRARAAFELLAKAEAKMVAVEESGRELLRMITEPTTPVPIRRKTADEE